MTAGSDRQTPAREVIVVRLGDGRYGVDLSWVAEVGRAPDVTRVPGMPEWVCGVANWRGRILPVVDLRRLLAVDPSGVARSSRLVVLNDGGVTVGVLVDQVVGTLTLGEPVAPVPAVLGGDPGGVLTGQVPLPDGPIALLDVPALAGLRDALPGGRRSA